MMEWLKTDNTPKMKIELNITLQNQNCSNNLTLNRDFKSHSTLYTTGAPLERVLQVPGNPSILKKAMQKSKILTKTSLNV